MTPKEKALELFDKYFDQMLSFGFHLTNGQIRKISLIAIDEIIHSINLIHEVFGTPIGYNIKYWKQVQKEIEKL